MLEPAPHTATLTVTPQVDANPCRVSPTQMQFDDERTSLLRAAMHALHWSKPVLKHSACFDTLVGLLFHDSSTVRRELYALLQDGMSIAWLVARDLNCQPHTPHHDICTVPLTSDNEAAYIAFMLLASGERARACEDAIAACRTRLPPTLQYQYVANHPTVPRHARTLTRFTTV